MPLRFNQDPLPIANVGERHVPAVLLVDISSSMGNGAIDELNKGLVEFGSALQNDPLALGRAEVCIISFNSSVQTEVGFRPAVEYEAPTLGASGLTSMNEAIEAGLDALEARKADYRANGVKYYRPWLFLLTDGAPTDTTREASAKARLQDYIKKSKVVYMPMGIGPHADIAKLQSYYPDGETVRPVLQASADQFREAFKWLSDSLSVVSRSDPKVATAVQTPPVPSCITVGI